MLTVSDPRLIEEPTYEATRCQPQIRAHSERNILTRAYPAGLESKTSRRGTSNDVNKSRNANIATFIDVTHSTSKQFRPRFPPGLGFKTTAQPTSTSAAPGGTWIRESPERSGATVIETTFSAPSCKVSNPIPSLETHMLTSSFEPPVPGFKSGNIRDGLGFEGGDQEVALEFEGTPKSFRGGTSSSSLITVQRAYHWPLALGPLGSRFSKLPIPESKRNNIQDVLGSETETARLVSDLRLRT
ncbi:hypothetical protein DFP72DRAFT_1067783 [Ephemerocybe angulata]|uniref:Uncharacterized protein n=1 Tax=Ephemerocybe angulata TaxID=980116 RepID=A0A8H6HYD4_9AGAR|nr:hypothetical protein DFP72DRAFT_1067783 [Tulosesus angulatus]